MLLELKRPADALAEYEAALREAPGRFNGLYGAARAAERANQPARAKDLYGKLVAQCDPNSTRPELAEAKRYLEKKGASGAATPSGAGSSARGGLPRSE